MFEAPDLETQLANALAMVETLTRETLAKTAHIEKQDKEIDLLRSRNTFLEGIRKQAWDAMANQ